MTLLEKYLVIDRLLSPWSSLGLWLRKMGNNPTRHQKKKRGIHPAPWFCRFICPDLCFAGETVLSEKCPIAFLIQTDSLLWCFWFWKPAFRGTRAVWCRAWRVWDASRIFHKEVGKRVRWEEQSALRSSTGSKQTLTTVVTLHTLSVTCSKVRSAEKSTKGAN